MSLLYECEIILIFEKKINVINFIYIIKGKIMSILIDVEKVNDRILYLW